MQKEAVLVRNITEHYIEAGHSTDGRLVAVHWLVADRIFDGKVEAQARFALRGSDWRTAQRGYYFV